MLPILSACQTAPEVAPNTGWADVTLRATGIGVVGDHWSAENRMQAVQAAKLDLYTQLEHGMLTRLTPSGKPVWEVFEDQIVLRQRIAAFARRAKIVKIENKEGGIHFSATLYLGEDFKSTVGLADKKPARDDDRPHVGPGFR